MHRFINQIVTAQQVPLTPTMSVKRVFPHHGFKNLDPFIFLDHFGPAFHKAGSSPFEHGTGAHPHRGFITFTYLFEGDMEHHDSFDNHSLVTEGGAQWMKAASGVVHDEKPSRAFLEKGGILDGLQLWINLPVRYKEDTPLYQALPKENVPELMLENGATLRILIGKYADLQSPIPMYSEMNVLHIQLAPNTKETLTFPSHWNVGIYNPSGEILFGESLESLKESQIAIFDQENNDIILQNPNDALQHAIILAAAPIGEPIIASGPFVMDSLEGVRRAYDDFYAGNYGEISY